MAGSGHLKGKEVSVRMSIAVLPMLIACGPTAGGDKNAGNTQDTSGPEVEPDPPGTATVDGAIVDPDGAPAVGVNVNLCNVFCYVTVTDDSGAFSYVELDANPYSLHLTTHGSPAWSDLLVITPVEDGEAVVFEDAFAMANANAETILSEAREEVLIADGFWIELAEGDVTLPVGVSGPVVVSGARVETMPTGLPVETPLAAWYIGYFDAEVADAPVRVLNEWGLEPGTTVEAQVASYRDYAWVEAGTLTVTPDGTELVGGAIPLLSTLVLVDPRL